MSQYTIERFIDLKRSYDELAIKNHTSPDERRQIQTLSEKLNECAQNLINGTRYAPALDWLCAQGQCRRKNCKCKGKSYSYMPDNKRPVTTYNKKTPEIFSVEHRLRSGQPTKKQIENAFKPLDDMIGMEDIKKEIISLVQNHIVNCKRRSFGLQDNAMGMHMVFTGNPGTGKTQVARMLGDIFRELGLLKKGQFIETDRSTLIGQYVGHTEKIVRQKINKSLDGILFIDEAYALDDGYYGEDAINTLIKAMEDNRDRLMIIVAGYPKEMKRFLAHNPGLHSRFPHHLHFPDYSGDESVKIFKKFCADQGYKLTASAEKRLAEILEKMGEATGDKFGNARGVRNLFEKSLKNQSVRLYRDDLNEKEDFESLIPEDIEQMAKEEKSATIGFVTSG